MRFAGNVLENHGGVEREAGLHKYDGNAEERAEAERELTMVIRESESGVSGHVLDGREVEEVPILPKTSSTNLA